MSTHVPFGLWIAVPVAVAIIFVGVTVVWWRAASGDVRIRVIAALTAWLGVAVLLAALGAFATSNHKAVPVIAFGIIIPMVVGLLLLRRPGALNRMLDSISPRALIGVQFYRVLGGVFIIAWAVGRMPAIFALPAGIGDIAVGLAAPFVATRLGNGTEGSRRLALGWNIAGIADFVSAVALGAATSPTSIWPTLLGHPNPLISRLPFVLIPVFVVPLSFLLHMITVRRLAVPVWEQERPPLDASSRQPAPRVPAAR